MPRRLTDRSLPPGLSSISPDVALFDDLLEKEKRLDWIMSRRRQEIHDTLQRGSMLTKRTFRIFMSHSVKNQAWQKTMKQERSNTGQENGIGEHGEGGDAQDGTEKGNEVPSWTFRIEGKLLPPPSVPAAKRWPAPQRKFSQMIRNLVIEMDRDPNVYPDTNHIQWTADPRWSNYNILGAYVTPPPAGDNTASGASSSNGSAPLDGFNVTRTGDVPTPLRITIQINHVPERIKLSPHLASILGVQEDTRQNIFGCFWHYVKANGLQDKNDRKLIRLDEKLRSVFKYESLNFQDIQALLAAHMHTADPLVLTYEIGTHCTDPTVSNPDGSSTDITMQDGTAMSGTQPGGIGVGKDGQSVIKAFDIELDMDDVWMRSKAGDVIMSMQPEAVTLGSGTTAPPSGTFLAIQKADDEIKSNMQVLRSLRTRRDFFQALADKPSSFMQNFVESQARDLEVILGNERAAEGGGAGGSIGVGSSTTGVRENDLMDSEFFQGDWVYEAVGVYEGMRMNHAVSAMHQAQQANLQTMQAMQHSGQVPMRG